MAIPSQQIGWSQRAKLLWNISKQLENLIKVAGNVQLTTTTTTTIAPTTTTTTTTSSSTTTTTTTVAPGIYTYILNDSGTPPLSGQFNSNTNSNFAYVPKTDLSGGTLATPQLGDLITYTNGSGGGWVNAVIDFIMDEGTWWYLYSNDSPFQPGMTNGANYPTTITPVYTIGESALGGVIAYILQPGDPGYDAGVQHGLVATVADISSGAEWGCNNTLITGADGTAIGTGGQNTVDIVAGCATPGIAAQLCLDLTEGGYSDWYLPSKDELNTLYINQVAVGGFTSSLYWSSTEFANYAAWVQDFTDGQQFDFAKLASHRVRAIRSF